MEQQSQKSWVDSPGQVVLNGNAPGKSVDSGLSLPQVLAISFWYPPKTEPRAIQVSRLLKHLQVSTVLACADLAENGASQLDDLGDTESFLQTILRVPFAPGGAHLFMNRVASHFNLPIWGRIPDPLVLWKGVALRSVEDFITQNRYKPAGLITFAFPLVDHLIGLELKRRYGFSWLAHFSDPWVDNPFKTDDRLTKAINTRLEKQVVEAADQLIFTSGETAQLVMAKYPDSIREKVTVIPHAYESCLFEEVSVRNHEELVVRYLGDLYSTRTPKPLFDGLKSLIERRPELLKNVRFELVGDMNDLKLDELGLALLPKDLVVVRPRVSYRESLSLMSSSDGLMVIDAPAQRSVFLPSKLIEYVGAARPIIGLSPPGAAADLISRLGGWVADPADPEAIATTLEQFLSFLVNNISDERKNWGPEDVRREYEAPAVARKFETVLRLLI